MNGIDFSVDTKGEHRWTVTGGNHEPLAVASEGYVELRDAEHGAEVTFAQLLRWMLASKGAEHVDALVVATLLDLTATDESAGDEPDAESNGGPS